MTEPHAWVRTKIEDAWRGGFRNSWQLRLLTPGSRRTRKRSVSFSERAPATKELAIARLERALSVRFPDDYRAFLLTVNGGRPDPACLRFEFGGETDDFHVHFFFGVDDPGEGCDLQWNAEITRETRTRELLPIACDDFGCRFYLTVRGPRVGEVLFGGLQYEGVVKYSRVAGSFGAFLEMLEDRGIE